MPEKQQPEQCPHREMASGRAKNLRPASGERETAALGKVPGAAGRGEQNENI